MSPLFSVIVPTYNRAQDLGRMLNAYEGQVGDVPFEVIVVDDGSADETLQVLHQRQRRDPRLRFCSQSNAGPSKARNRGLELARGKYVLFTGDDIVPNRDLVLRHMMSHEAYGEEGLAILGHISWPDDIPVTSTMRHVDGIGAQQFSYQFFEHGQCYDFRHFYTSNISVSRSLLEKERTGFSTDFPFAAFEDAELAYRLRRHGLRILYQKEPRAVHYHPYTADTFFKRQVRCGKMASLFYAKYPELKKWFELSFLEQLRIDTLKSQDSERFFEGQASSCTRMVDLEQRALRLAGFYDHCHVPPIDDLLRALFRYGYLKGVVEGVYPSDAGWMSCALFEAVVVPAVAAFGRDMNDHKLPFPAADSSPILEMSEH